MGNLKKKQTNATSYLNIGSLKITIGYEWNKISEEFILKASKSFQRHSDTIIEKKMVAILSKFTVLCLYSYLVVFFFFKLKLILFYNRVIYYYTRIFLILHPHSAMKQ